jgi:hypothetical protein
MAFMAMPIAFLASPFMTVTPEFVGYQAEFIGQEAAEVGELCRFLAEGDIITWECLPKTPDCESYGEKNENFVISFRKPGTYTVIAAICTEGDLDIHTMEVVVEGPPVVVVDPEDPVDGDVDAELVVKVRRWAEKYNVDSEQCKALSANFTDVASAIEAGDLVTPNEIIIATANKNSDLKLNEALMAELQAYLTSQADVGNLRTPEQHLSVWNSIAKGLRDAAS